MKKIISIILTVALSVCCLSLAADAKTTYTAEWGLTAKVGNSTFGSTDTVSVMPGSTVYVTLSLKNNYYAGVMCANIFYSTNIFSGTGEAKFNTNGKYFDTCSSTYSLYTPWDKMAPAYHTDKSQWPSYSATKLDDFMKSHRYAHVTMIPNMLATSTPAKDINENLVTIPFTVSKNAANGSTGEIVLPSEAARSSTNKTAPNYLARFETTDMRKNQITYADNMLNNCSKAVLKFKVTTKGDVNGDGAINSNDALLILQNTVGSINLTAEQKARADVNSDSKINSADALNVLQFSVGTISSF